MAESGEWPWNVIIFHCLEMLFRGCVPVMFVILYDKDKVFLSFEFMPKWIQVWDTKENKDKVPSSLTLPSGSPLFKYYSNSVSCAVAYDYCALCTIFKFLMLSIYVNQHLVIIFRSTTVLISVKKKVCGEWYVTNISNVSLGLDSLMEVRGSGWSLRVAYTTYTL